jgi:hypothetical protein
MTDPVQDATDAVKQEAATIKSAATSIWAKVWPLAAALAIGFVVGLIA